MAQEPVIQIDNSAKSRISRLFKFLYEANRLRNQPERTLQDQVTVIPLTGLPEHPSLQLVRPVAAEGQPPAEFEFRIARARTTRCAEPPPVLRDWLISGWDDPIKSAAHVESLNKTNDEGESTTIAFSDDTERTSAWERWIAIRDAWVEPEIRARAALAFFERIYELYALLEKDGERLELVVADGLLNWQVRSVMENADVQIHHPILLKRIELSFDASKPEFIFSDTDRETEIYTSLLIDLEGLNASGIDVRQRELASAGYHPLGFADAQAFMTALVQTISPTRGEFLEEKGNGFDAHPRLWRDPVLLVRRRVQGVTNAISRIIDDIEAKEVFPPAFGQIVGMPTDWQDNSIGQGAPGNEADTATKSASIDDDEILLAKETNAEQMQIIRRLATSGSVLVQGPPGTGKTHTIGNIIGHLLAQGKSVLVTSHTPKALRVLRDQIPEDLRPLCVSAVGGDRESRRQLETAITEINARLARSSVEVLRGQIDDRVKERRKLLEENRRLTAKLREALESEYQEILSLGKAITPAEAARYVKKHTPPRAPGFLAHSRRTQFCRLPPKTSHHSMQPVSLSM